jgi:glutathione S-transferase
MKLYWSPRSPFVRKTLVAIHELGLAERIEILPVTVKMEEINPAMLAVNPLGKIPTLVLEDGAVLVDSFAIIDFLDELAGRKLIPASGEARRQVLRQHALANGLMDLLVLWRNERDKPVEQHSAGWIANFEAKTRLALTTFEAEAGDLATMPLGLGQISIAVVLSYLDFRFGYLDWRQGRPALAAWHAGFSQRPSMQATEAAA